jgi:hypothetical protein
VPNDFFRLHILSHRDVTTRELSNGILPRMQPVPDVEQAKHASDG